MRFALMIEPQQGISWRQQVILAQRAEGAGFDTLFRSDHYESFPGPSGRETSDGWAVIAGLVRETGTIRHGTLVSPVTFRHPGNLAKVVATIDHMSDGRVELGLGAGWHADEHRRHGFAFPDLATRLDLLEEQLEVVSGLWARPAGWSFRGHHYTVEDALFVLPPVQRPRPPLIVGTRGAARGVRMAARLADELNLYYCGAEAARRVFQMLDAECAAIGRDPRSVTRSVLLGTVVGEDRAATDARLTSIRATFEYPGGAAEWAAEHGDVWLVGTPDEVAGRIRQFADAGADRVVFQDFLPDDLGMISLLGTVAGSWSPRPSPGG